MRKIKILRVKAGYKTKEAAKLLGIKQCTLYKIESGQRKPSNDLKIKMALLYKCKIENLE